MKWVSITSSIYNICIIILFTATELHINESMNFKVSYYNINIYIYCCINNTRNLKIKYVMRIQRRFFLISEEYSYFSKSKVRDTIVELLRLKNTVRHSFVRKFIMLLIDTLMHTWRLRLRYFKYGNTSNQLKLQYGKPMNIKIKFNKQITKLIFNVI